MCSSGALTSGTSEPRCDALSAASEWNGSYNFPWILIGALDRGFIRLWVHLIDARLLYYPLVN